MKYNYNKEHTITTELKQDTKVEMRKLEKNLCFESLDLLFV